MPQYSYDFASAILGQLAVYDPASIDSLINSLPAQVSTVTTGGTATDGVYRITVTGEEGTFVAEHTRTGAETNDDVTTALQASWAGNDAASNIADMANVASVNTLTFLHSGSSYTITVEAPAPGTLVAALVTDPSGSGIPLAIMLVSDDGKFGRLPTAGDVAGDMWGITIRNAELIQELALPSATTLDFLPASAMGVMREGECWVAPVAAVAVNDPVFVALGTGADAAGTLRGTADGGNTVQVSGRWKTAAAAGALAKVLLNMP